MKIGIVTDSTCDLPPEVIKSLGIKVVPLYINIGKTGYLDGVEITREEFYKNLPDFDVHPQTGVPGIDKFTDAYQQLLNEGADQILSLHISESLSATINIARKAAEKFGPGTVTAVDSGQLSLGLGFMVERAAEMAVDGHSFDDIDAALSDMQLRTYVFAALDTLEFLRRSGRMNRFVVGLGSLLQLKPLMKMYAGEPSSERVRTDSRAYERVLEILQNLGPYEKLAIVHANANEKAARLRQAAQELETEGDLYFQSITPVLGTHIGPGAYGFAVVSKAPATQF